MTATYRSQLLVLLAIDSDVRVGLEGKILAADDDDGERVAHSRPTRFVGVAGAAAATGVETLVEDARDVKGTLEVGIEVGEGVGVGEGAGLVPVEDDGHRHRAGGSGGGSWGRQRLL